MTPPTPLQFVVLRHDGIDEPHFDLLFETAPGSDLAAFRTPVWPLVTDTKLTRLRDHRRLYLTYQGPISNSRGNVQRIDGGDCQIIPQPGVITLRAIGRDLEIRLIQNGDEWEAVVA